MGARGPAPTPRNILQMRSSWRADRGGESIAVEAGRPQRPEDLVDGEAKLWDALVALLERVPGLLATLDGPQLERYVVYFCRWRRLNAEIAEFTGKTGSVWKSLATTDLRAIYRTMVAESHRLDVALKQIEGQFAMTPAARRRLELLAGEQPADRQKQGKARFFGA